MVKHSVCVEFLVLLSSFKGSITWEIIHWGTVSIFAFFNKSVLRLSCYGGRRDPWTRKFPLKRMKIRPQRLR